MHPMLVEALAGWCTEATHGEGSGCMRDDERKRGREEDTERRKHSSFRAESQGRREWSQQNSGQPAAGQWGARNEQHDASRNGGWTAAKEHHWQWACVACKEAGQRWMLEKTDFPRSQQKQQVNNKLCHKHHLANQQQLQRDYKNSTTKQERTEHHQQAVLDKQVREYNARNVEMAFEEGERQRALQNHNRTFDSDSDSSCEDCCLHAGTPVCTCQH